MRSRRISACSLQEYPHKLLPRQLPDDPPHFHFTQGGQRLRRTQSRRFHQFVHVNGLFDAHQIEKSLLDGRFSMGERFSPDKDARSRCVVASTEKSSARISVGNSSTTSCQHATSFAPCLMLVRRKAHRLG